MGEAGLARRADIFNPHDTDRDPAGNAGRVLYIYNNSWIFFFC